MTDRKRSYRSSTPTSSTSPHTIRWESEVYSQLNYIADARQQSFNSLVNEIATSYVSSLPLEQQDALAKAKKRDEELIRKFAGEPEKE